ncbi:MAG: glycosyl transferase [Actinobacteria bacterium HGW-Actinobacteria-8]|nr:MAG: glycosyl transferase [Actinobacteria bacterium HGW-Actinobacteria-8]
MSRTWVVVPTFNEATVVGKVVRDLVAEFEFVVCVDDGSNDDSAEVARAAGAHVVTHPINLGQGASLQTGFDYALLDPAMTEVLTFDADGQHQIADARDMIELLHAENLAIVTGSRFLDTRTQMTFLKRLTLRTAARVSRVTTGKALTDAHNGLRVLRRDVLETVRITQNRMAHASELVDLLAATGLPWKEHPTHIMYTDYSRSKGQSLLNGVNILVELLFK